LFAAETPVKFYDVTEAKDILEAAQMKPAEPSAELSLAEYLTNIEAKNQFLIHAINDKTFKNPILYGITSLSCHKELLPDYGCTITWKEGYDESIFLGKNQVCIIPESMAEEYDNGNGSAELSFSRTTRSYELIDGKYQLVDKVLNYQCTIKIVGTYTAGDEKSIFCPFSIVTQVRRELQSEQNILYLSATLSDNSRLEEFREKASYCFAEPSLDDEKIRWSCFANDTYHEYYDYALDINDDNLFDLSAILEKSIKFNRTVTVFVVILSVVSGFLVGFLMIRRRKRDIMLMRTVGESTFSLYVGFVIEQMICVLLGIIVGGAYYMWNPIKNLALFALLYFVGLTLSLVVFMNTKLIKNLKEDE